MISSSSSQRLSLDRSRSSPRVSRPSRASHVVVRAERSGDSFMSGFIVGGVVFGALGFIFAPQISKAMLGDDAKLRLPHFLDDEGEKDPAATKQDLIEKINQLNKSIDEVQGKLSKDQTVADAMKIGSA